MKNLREYLNKKGIEHDEKDIKNLEEIFEDKEFKKYIIISKIYFYLGVILFIFLFSLFFHLAGFFGEYKEILNTFIELSFITILFVIVILNLIILKPGSKKIINLLLKIVFQEEKNIENYDDFIIAQNYFIIYRDKYGFKLSFAEISGEDFKKYLLEKIYKHKEKIESLKRYRLLAYFKETIISIEIEHNGEIKNNISKDIIIEDYIILKELKEISEEISEEINKKLKNSKISDDFLEDTENPENIEKKLDLLDLFLK